MKFTQMVISIILMEIYWKLLFSWLKLSICVNFILQGLKQTERSQFFTKHKHSCLIFFFPTAYLQIGVLVCT